MHFFKIKNLGSRKNLIENLSTTNNSIISSIGFQDPNLSFNYDVNSYPLSTPISIEKKTKIESNIDIPIKEKYFSLKWFLHQIYIPLLLKPWVKVG